MRADFGITYDADALKLIDDLREWGLSVRGVVITRFDDQPAPAVSKQMLSAAMSASTLTGFPRVSYGRRSDRQRRRLRRQSVHRDRKPLVVVTGPGPGSGKLATCLSQLYHDHLHGIDSGYAKFETFPIWNLPLKHPVNVAYEAATADFRDVNMVDPFHLDAYGEDRDQLQSRRRGLPGPEARSSTRITGAEPSTSRPPTWA